MGGMGGMGGIGDIGVMGGMGVIGGIGGWAMDGRMGGGLQSVVVCNGFATGSVLSFGWGVSKWIKDGCKDRWLFLRCVLSIN